MQQVFSDLDLEIYFAESSELLAKPELFDGLITNALALAESPMGANRALGKKTYVDQKLVPSVGRVFLSYSPISSSSLVVQIRGDTAVLYDDFLLSGNQWRSVASSAYTFDSITNELAFYNLTAVGLYGGLNRLYGPYSSRPTKRYESLMIKAQYEAGFDWCDDTDQVKQLKAALAGLCKLTANSKGFSSGYSSYKLEGFYQVDFDNDATSSTLNAYLSVFQRYRGIV